MRVIHLSLIAVALFGTVFVGPALHSSASGVLPRAFRTETLELTACQLLFKGKPVDEIMSGRKIKKYSMELTGTGFVSGSRVVVNSRRAFGFDTLDNSELRIETTYESDMHLRAQFLHRQAPAGLLVIKVVNAEAQESNTLTVDVISQSSDLSITSISPESGPTGTLLTFRGVGFAPSPVPVFNCIRFTAEGSEPSRSATGFVGRYADSTSDDNTLTFVVPTSVVDPVCPGSKYTCDPLRVPLITPQPYRIQVINSNGMSNSIFFQITPK